MCVCVCVGYWKKYGVLRGDWGKNFDIIQTESKFHHVISWEESNTLFK
jgi:hypothetical protein